MNQVSELFGGIDIYLFDQIQKGRFERGMRILDAGCGGGRNIFYFLRSGFDVFGIDRSREAIDDVRKLAASLAPELPAGNFRVAPIDEIPLEDSAFDAVISSAVLHFAADEEHFRRMLDGMWRVLRPGGMLFVRLASSIGIESRVVPLGGRRFALPDGSERFLVDEEVCGGRMARSRGGLKPAR